MNKKLIRIVTSATLLLLPFAAMALSIPPAPNISNSTANFSTIITNGFNNVVWPAFFVIIVVYILIIGFLFLSAQGDPGKVATARQALLWGVVGIVVFVLAFVLISVVTRTFGL